MITEAQKLRAATLTEEERNAYAVCLKYVLDVPASEVIRILESLAESRAREGELVAALDSLEVVTRAYLRYPLKGEEPGWDAKDVLAYCDEARAVLPQEKKDWPGPHGPIE